jgi:hypothetical protein
MSSHHSPSNHFQDPSGQQDESITPQHTHSLWYIPLCINLTFYLTLPMYIQFITIVVVIHASGRHFQTVSLNAKFPILPLLCFLFFLPSPGFIPFMCRDS